MDDKKEDRQLYLEGQELPDGLFNLIRPGREEYLDLEHGVIVELVTTAVVPEELPVVGYGMIARVDFGSRDEMLEMHAGLNVDVDDRKAADRRTSLTRLLRGEDGLVLASGSPVVAIYILRLPDSFEGVDLEQVTGTKTDIDIEQVTEGETDEMIASEGEADETASGGEADEPASEGEADETASEGEADETASETGDRTPQTFAETIDETIGETEADDDDETKVSTLAQAEVDSI
jgi:hypothetical protein